MDKKIEETREFLQTIGMPKAQQADICCYVILAMAGIKPDMSWSEATNEWIRIHDIIQFVNTFYGIWHWGIYILMLSKHWMVKVSIAILVAWKAVVLMSVDRKVLYCLP